MRIQLHAHRPLPAGPAVVDAFLGDASTWLPRGARKRPFGGWRVELEGAGLIRETAMSVGSGWLDGDAVWRPLRWEPLDDERELIPMDTLLPVFVGELGITGEVPGGRRLELRGIYTPPGGLIGGVLDRAGLHRVAQATAERLLAEIADRLAFRSEQATAHVVTSHAEGPGSVGTVGPGPQASRP